MPTFAEKHTPGILANSEVLAKPVGTSQLTAFLEQLGQVEQPDKVFWGEYTPEAVIIATSSNRKAQAVCDALRVLEGQPLTDDEKQRYTQPLEYMMMLRDLYWNGNKAFPEGMQYLGMLKGVPIIMQATNGELGAHGVQSSEAFNKLEDVRQHYEGENVLVIGLDGEDEFAVSRRGKMRVKAQGKLSGREKYPFPAGQREFSDAQKQELERWFRTTVLKSLFAFSDPGSQAWLVSVTAVAARDGLDAHSTEATAVLANPVTRKELIAQLPHVEPQAPLGGLQQFDWFSTERGNECADKYFQQWLETLPEERRYQSFFELLTIIGVPMHAILKVIQTLVEERQVISEE